MSEKEKVLKIPVSGSLGLLALGHRGVTAWRKVRDKTMEEEPPESYSNKDE